ncbi:uncharacterized protein LOC113665051 [Pocillopora damicornis]|uniref:uncharacterized protein LOC113665051 n=1 Tax=Pocillopora damicornis TaxID=46731 RepID=UPI000F558470|nr:uncharacterized protein LOC113665051 [Pocillopora damicornis]
MCLHITKKNLSENDTDCENISQQLPQWEESGSFVNTTEETLQPDCNNYNWQNNKCKYEHHIIGEMPSWVKSKKDTFSVALPQQNIDISTFSDMQAHAYNMINAHSEQASPKDPLLLIVNGVAGTGKSYLINAIQSLLGTSCAVTATTGKASFNINGLNQRAQGTNPEQCQFRDLFMRLRTGDCTEKDWKLLLTRQPSNTTNLTEFQNATRLYFSNEEVANYNFEKLSALHNPIARVNARHSSDLAKKASPDEMAGLKPCVFPAKGAQVMLTMNLRTDVGLCNGATGTVIDFIYADNHQPPDLPQAVIVKFDNYKGPSISKSISSCVPICPIRSLADHSAQ